MILTKGIKLLLTAACLLSAAGLFIAAPGAATEEAGLAGRITADAIKGHVYFLASDALEGRYVGSRGYDVAARYGESQFRAAGLEPCVTAGAGLSYLQQVPVLRRMPTGGITLEVAGPGGTRTFKEGDDFIWFQGEMFPWVGRPLDVVYVGYGISEPGYGWDDLEGVDVRGKMVLLMMGAPLDNGEPVLPEVVHARYAAPAGVLRKMVTMLFEGAAGILVLPDEMLLGAWDDLPSKAANRQFEYDNIEPDAVHIPLLSPIKPAVAEAVFEGRGGLPPGTGDAGRERTPSFQLEGVKVTLGGSFDEERIPTYNVVGVVEGTDPRLKQEYVAVTAHLDSTAPREPGEINNGADDNASGAAGVIEVARVVAEHPPRRSVVFVLLSGEEAACIGSRHFVSSCPVALDKVVADVNLDMIARSDPACEADRSHYAIDSGRITPEFTALIKDVNAATVDWPLKYESPTGNSDNLMFHAVGIPGVCFYSGHHDDVNLPTDDPEKLDYDKAEKISRLVYELTMELGNRENLW
jgi:hypothetical protein